MVSVLTENQDGVGYWRGLGFQWLDEEIWRGPPLNIRAIGQDERHDYFVTEEP